MKKIVSQILLILLIMIIGMSSTFIKSVNAESIAGLNVSSATVGGNISVSLILPGNAYGANCTITITYSDGTTSSDRLVYMSGMSDFPNQVTFPAKVAGNATVNATGIKIANANSDVLEEGGSKSQSINIGGGNANTGNPSNPSTPAPSNNGNANSSTPTNNQPKEPEVVNPQFKDVKETVYAVQGCNVRSSCSSEIGSNKIGGLVAGQSVTRTGVADGWSRISYNGKTAYVASRLLTTEEPVKEPENNTVSSENTLVNNTLTNATNTTQNHIANEVVGNTMLSKEEQLKELQETIGVLPEVGNNIAVYLFYIISGLGIVICLIMYYKHRSDSI